MPNHIKNVVFFYGDMEEIKKMRKEISSSGREDESDYVLDFNKLIPMPPELDIEAGSNSDTAHAAYCILNDINTDSYCVSHWKQKYEESKSEMPFKDWFALYIKECETILAAINLKSGNDLIISAFKALYAKEKGRKKKFPDFDFWLSRKVERIEKIDFALGKKVQENIEKYGAPNWYDWRIQHWGTKWNCYECEDEGPRRIAFLTAWAPPDPVFDELARRYPKIEFTCYSVDEGDAENVWERKYEKGELSEQYTFKDAELVQRIWDASGNEFTYKEERNEH